MAKIHTFSFAVDSDRPSYLPKEYYKKEFFEDLMEKSRGLDQVRITPYPTKPTCIPICIPVPFLFPFPVLILISIPTCKPISSPSPLRFPTTHLISFQRSKEKYPFETLDLIIEKLISGIYNFPPTTQLNIN